MTTDSELGGGGDDSGGQGGSTYRQILRSSAIVGGSSIASMMIGLVRTKVMAMLLGPAGVGLMGALNSIADLARTLAELGINSSGVRQIAESVGTGDSGRIALTVRVLRWVALTLGAVGGLVLAVFSKPVAVMTFGDGEQAWAVALLGVVVLFRLVSDGQGALLQGMRRVGDIARINILGALIGTALTIGLIAWLRQRGIAIALMASAGASLGLSWWYSRQVRIERTVVPFDVVSREARALLQLGLAFMTSSLLTLGAAYAVRVVLIRSNGLEGAGLFQAAWAVGGLYVAFVLQAMGTDFYPRLIAAAENNAESNRLVNEQVMVSLLLSGMGVMATLTLAPWVVALLYTEKFADATDLLRWICLGMALRVVTWPLGYILVAKGKRAWFVTADLLWTLMYIGLTWLSVRWFGLTGAGGAFFGAYVFHFFVVYPMCRRVSGFRWSRDAARTATSFVVAIAVVQAGFVLLPPTPALGFGIAATALSVIASILVLGRLVSPQYFPRRFAWLLRIVKKRK